MCQKCCVCDVIVQPRDAASRSDDSLVADVGGYSSSDRVLDRKSTPPRRIDLTSGGVA